MPDTAVALSPSTAQATDHVDVLIVGAGISGIGGAYHLTHQLPGTSFVVLETQESFGGTWLTHRYPGIRSDSDLYTFGYRFKPWTGKPIASAQEILSYMGEVIEENDLARHIRYSHRIDRASWSREDKRWTVEGVRTDTGDAFRIIIATARATRRSGRAWPTTKAASFIRRPGPRISNSLARRSS